MKELIRDLSVYLPLTVDSIVWNDAGLRLLGMTWEFFTANSWRIVVDQVLEYACCDDKVPNPFKPLDKAYLTSIEIQSRHLPVDPVFVFSNGCKLEIFTSTQKESWTFRSPSGVVHIASFD